MKNIFFFALLSTIIFSCKKNNDSNGKGPDVYVCGTADNQGTALSAIIWKNGVGTFLSGLNIQSSANSVFVSGDDVYAAGYEAPPNYRMATYWKNGTPVYLTSTPGWAEAHSIFVSGTDVYVVGYVTSSINNSTTIGKLWKNGVATSLTDGITNGDANCVFVSGTDVYVAGYQYNSATKVNNATIWKNGIPTALTPTVPSRISSVFVSGNDVYAAGYIYEGGPYNVAYLWKNGVGTRLEPNIAYPIINTAANSVYVSGNDVYIAGVATNGATSFAVYWKNGVQTVLSNASKSSYAASIGFADNTVFIAGNQNSTTTGYDATLWKNYAVSSSKLNGTSPVAYVFGMCIK
jgi:sulfur transfer complex TusBCD TusB component (DsrH family)